jgi:phospholipid/cholesterol/gamma-HCH transport system substrate-binding protein
MRDLSKLNPIMANVDKAVLDLKEIIADVKAGNGTVGKLLRDEEVIDRVNETLSGVSQIVNRVNNYRTDISLYSGASFNDGTRTQLDVDLIPAPERFFRFGLIQTDFGRDISESKRVTTSVDGNPSSTTNTETVNEDEFKFNLQIGRKLNNWIFRVGLIDSTGGIGVDYNLYHLGLGATLEAFDFDEDLGPAMRFGLESRLWNIIYARATAEDFLSKDGDQNYTLSVGLKFTDEDLAALIGLAI